MHAVLLLTVSYSTKLLPTDVGRIVVQHGHQSVKQYQDTQLEIRTALILKNRTNHALLLKIIKF